MNYENPVLTGRIASHEAAKGTNRSQGLVQAACIKSED